MNSRHKEWWFKGVAVVTATVLSVAAGEALLRLYSPIESEITWRIDNQGPSGLLNKMYFFESGHLPFMYRPSVAVSPPGEVPYRATNHRGFRDIEYTDEPATGTYRIVLLGDSVAAGDPPFTMPVKNTFENIIEHELNLPGRCARPVEIINLSVPAYDTELEVRMFETYGLRLKPEAVWVAFFVNDIHDPPPIMVMEGGHARLLTFFGTSRDDENPLERIGGWRGTLFHKSALFRFVFTAPLYLRAMNPDEDALPRHQTRARGALARLVNEVNKRNMFINVFLLHELHHSTNQPELIMRQVRDPMQRWAGELGFPLLDTFGRLDGDDPPSLRVSKNDQAHLTEKGHRVVARVLLELMTERHLLPPTCH